jgi:gluconokinase
MTLVDLSHAHSPLILTIDVGSSSTRTLLFDQAGHEIAGSLARVSHTLHTSADGGVEDDPDAALERIERCIDATLASAGTTAIGAVAVTTYVSNVLGVAADHRPLTPIYLYADTRNAADAAHLRKQLDEPAILDRTGCPLRANYLPARLRWLQRTQADVVRRVWRWVTLGEYMLLRWFGEAQVSFSVASWSGLLDRRMLQWDEQLLAVAGLDPARLSQLVDADAPISGLRADYARRWPALAQIPWFPAIGDGAAANLGSGCADPAYIALTIGTSGALRAVLPHVEQVPFGLWCYRVDRRRALLGGATSEGGNVFAWMREVLRLADPADVEAALASGEPDGHGLTVLPFLAGERSPGWASDARATISGLSLNTTANDMLRAGLEAVAYRFGRIARLLTPQLPSQPTFVVSGGALLNSPSWCQILADVLGCPLYASAVGEPSSRGAALLALESLGLANNRDPFPLEFTQIYSPDPDHHQRYLAAMERQHELYERLVGVRSEE